MNNSLQNLGIIKLEKVFILILAIGVAIFIALPFFRKKVEEASSQEESGAIRNPIEEKLRKLNFEKESLYAALKEIDFDYDLGKLSKEDYEELQKKYKLQAAPILKEIDDVRIKTGIINLEEEVEKEIRLNRKAKLTDGEEIEREILKARKSNGKDKTNLICSNCGKEAVSDDKFCSNCGNKLNEYTNKQDYK